MQQASASKTRLIDLLRASGDEDLGAGLLRLAHRAAAMHRAEVAAARARGESLDQEVARANGLARSSTVVATLATGRDTDRTEVGR